MLAIAAIAVGGSQVSATGAGLDERQEGVGKDNPEQLATCFAFGIDQVGRGNLGAGIELLEPCLADDYVFEFVFFEGGPAIICPGDECPVSEYSSPADLRAKFANAFFVDAGYLATQHQLLNLDVTYLDPKRAEVVGDIQANHFLPDNSVDIAWNDYHIEAVRTGGQWQVVSETIVGTAFLNFQGGLVGGDAGGDRPVEDPDEHDASGGLPVGADITLRNTLEEEGSPETAFPALFGQSEDAFDEFSTLSLDEVEFATALAQPGTPVGDISGLYEIDMTGSEIHFTLLPTADDPFWVNVFEDFPPGKFDRYYLTFSEPHNVESFRSSNNAVTLRVDSPTVLVVEIGEGYEMHPGVSFHIHVE